MTDRELLDRKGHEVNDDLPPLPEPVEVLDLWGNDCPVYNREQMRAHAIAYARAAVLAERELWDLLDKHGVCLSRNYIRDASGRFNGWMACGHGGAFMSKGETMRDAALACADAIRKGTP